MSESTADMRSEPVEDRKHGEDPSTGSHAEPGKPMRPTQSAGKPMRPTQSAGKPTPDAERGQRRSARAS